MWMPTMPRTLRSTLVAALIGVSLGAGGLAAFADPPRGGYAPDPPPHQSRTNWVFDLSARAVGDVTDDDVLLGREKEGDGVALGDESKRRAKSHGAFVANATGRDAETELMRAVLVGSPSQVVVGVEVRRLEGRRGDAVAHVPLFS